MIYEEQLNYYNKLKFILGWLVSNESAFTIRDIYYLLLDATKCKKLKDIKLNQLYLHNLIYKYFASNKNRRSFYVVDVIPINKKISYLYYSINNRADLINYDASESWDESEFELENKHNNIVFPIIYLMHAKCISNKFDNFDINFELLQNSNELIISKKDYFSLFLNYNRISSFSFKENIVKKNAYLQIQISKNLLIKKLKVSNDSLIIKLLSK